VNQDGPSGTAHGSSEVVKAHTPRRGRHSCRNIGVPIRSERSIGVSTVMPLLAREGASPPPPPPPPQAGPALARPGGASCACGDGEVDSETCSGSGWTRMDSDGLGDHWQFRHLFSVCVRACMHAPLPPSLPSLPESPHRCIIAVRRAASCGGADRRRQDRSGGLARGVRARRCSACALVRGMACGGRGPVHRAPHLSRARTRPRCGR
jgi:hypothetical protein